MGVLYIYQSTSMYTPFLELKFSNNFMLLMHVKGLRLHMLHLISTFWYMKKKPTCRNSFNMTHFEEQDELGGVQAGRIRMLLKRMI